MSVLTVQCVNCGAKYKLPETFAADKAKCKSCGAVIDVKAQRAAPAEAPAAPATAQPAAKVQAPAPKPAARPAAAAPAPRSSAPAAAHAGPATAASHRSARHAAGQDKEGGARGSGRHRHGHGHGHGHERKKGANPMVFVGVGVGVAALIGIAWWGLSGGDAPSQTPTAQNQPAAQTPAAGQQTPAQANAAGAAAAKPSETGTPPDLGAKPAEAASAPKPVEPAKPAAKPAEKPGVKITSPDQVFQPAKELQPLAWPEGTTDDQKQEITDLIGRVRDGGMPGNRAKTQLAAKGYNAMVGMINALREVDYKDSEQSMFGGELNKLMEQMTYGLNAGYKHTLLGEDVPLETAHHNGQTVRAWQTVMVRTLKSPEEFTKVVVERQKSRDKDDNK
ncbi:MAG: hypothetical protein IT458_19945 [Planctomycetes bacterium]|nr:hypothetical protein [Planctomycetota bacterium]